MKEKKDQSREKVKMENAWMFSKEKKEERK